MNNPNVARNQITPAPCTIQLLLEGFENAFENNRLGIYGNFVNKI